MKRIHYMICNYQIATVKPRKNTWVKASQMSQIVMFSLWCASLSTNTRFRFLYIRINNCYAHIYMYVYISAHVHMMFYQKTASKRLREDINPRLTKLFFVTHITNSLDFCYWTPYELVFGIKGANCLKQDIWDRPCLIQL